MYKKSFFTKKHYLIRGFLLLNCLYFVSPNCGVIRINYE